MCAASMAVWIVRAVTNRAAEARQGPPRIVGLGRTPRGRNVLTKVRIGICYMVLHELRSRFDKAEELYCSVSRNPKLHARFGVGRGDR